MTKCKNCNIEIINPKRRRYCSTKCVKAHEVISWKIRRASARGQIRHKKANAKRERELGYHTLNNPFPNSEGHHINSNDVIYIPKTLHRRYYHDHKKLETMVKVNINAFIFMNSNVYTHLIESYTLNQ